MALRDDLPPEEHRKRYEALLAGARARAEPVMPPPAALDPAMVSAHEHIPAGWYHTLHLRRGQALRLLNTGGTPGVSALFWNAADRSERFSAADTMKVQWTARLRGGLVLLSDMGRVMAAVIADTSGTHDMLLGGSTPAPGGGRNSRDNFLLAAGKHGLGARDVSPCITFFAGVQVGAGGRLTPGDAPPAGGVVDLLAEMDLLVALSNCPHPLQSADAAADIEAITWQAPPGAGLPARTAGPEATRAYENTDRMTAP